MFILLAKDVAAGPPAGVLVCNPAFKSLPFFSQAGRELDFVGSASFVRSPRVISLRFFGEVPSNPPTPEVPFTALPPSTSGSRDDDRAEILADNMGVFLKFYLSDALLRCPRC